MSRRPPDSPSLASGPHRSSASTRGGPAAPLPGDGDVCAPWPTGTQDVSPRLAWALLAAFVAVGIVGRLLYLRYALASPDFAWIDPDHYMAQARHLFAGGSWEWTAEAVHYRHRGRLFHLPPLYPVFLSLFGLGPWPWPLSAAVAQALLPVASSVALYAMGTNLHSRRAGLIAGALVAVTPAQLTTGAVFMQEQLYIPVLLSALACVTWGLVGTRSRSWWIATGVVMGVATLARSMPLYFVPVAVAVCLWNHLDRRLVLSQFGFLVLGLLAVTVSYSVFLSADVGRWIFIEDHASISLTAYTGVIYSRPPSFTTEVGDLLRSALRTPERFFGTFFDYFQAAFRLAGARWGQIYFGGLGGPVRMAVEAYGALMTDVVFGLAVVLAPFGLILARCRAAASVLIAWPIVGTLLTAIAAYGGPRYRAPFELVLYVFLGVVLARAWASPTTRAVIGAAVASAGLFLLIR